MENIVPEASGVNWKIYLEDCLDGMARLPEGSAHCICTDPPFGMGYISNRRTHKSDIVKPINNDKTFDPVFFDKVMMACHRVLTENSHIYVFTQDSVLPHMFFVFTRYFDFKNINVWDTGNHTSGDLEGSYGKQTEFVLFGHKGRRPLLRGRPSNLTAYPKINAVNMLHVSQKPLGIVSYYLSNSTEPGETVCDPFGGSFTTAIAALKLGRNFIGFENDKANFEIGKARIEREMAQGSLF